MTLHEEPSLPHRLRAFVDRLTPVKWTTPHDLAEHKAELTRRILVGDDSPYTKSFQFPEIDGDQATKLGQDVLDHLDHVPANLQAAVEAEVINGLRQIRVIEARDDDALNDWTVAAYSEPPEGTIREATTLLASHETGQPSDRSALSREDLAAAMREALHAYDLAHWTVKIDANMAAEASVVGHTSTIKISQGGELPIAECRRLVVHEIGGHVLRWENARRQPTPWAEFGFGNTVPTEEGLAALVEEELGVATTQTRRRYAVRVHAVVASRTRNLLELALHLGTLLPPFEAAALTLRIRRGLTSPLSTGGITKDHGYLTGLLSCRRLASEDREGLALLRGTKWPCDYLSLARRLADEGRLMPAKLTADPQMLSVG